MHESLSRGITINRDAVEHYPHSWTTGLQYGLLNCRIVAIKPNMVAIFSIIMPAPLEILKWYKLMPSCPKTDVKRLWAECQSSVSLPASIIGLHNRFVRASPGTAVILPRQWLTITPCGNGGICSAQPVFLQGPDQLLASTIPRAPAPALALPVLIIK